MIGVISYYLRAYRWNYALEPMGYDFSSTNRFYAVMIGYMINLTLPRAGEASRAVALSKSDGVPFTVGFGTVVSERIVDIAFILGITIFAFLLGQEDFIRIKWITEDYFGPKSESTSNFIYPVIGFVFLFGVIIYALNQKIRDKIREVIISLYKSAISIFKTKNPVAYIFTFFTYLDLLFAYVLFAIPGI